MTFLGKAEVLPPLFGQQGSDLGDPHAEKRLETLRWLVLSATFLVVLLLGMIYVWSRPALYQSKAILHISYVSATGEDAQSLSLEQVSLNQQRLTSFRVLQQVSDKLLLSRSIVLSVEQLSQMLSSFMQPASSTIALQAIGTDPQVLEPVLSTTLDIYLQQLNAENTLNSGDDLLTNREKLDALQQKITVQREELAAFSEANNIISLERDENRILSKIKSLGMAIDEAEAQKIEAAAALSSIEASIARGQALTRPEDQAAIDSIAQQLAEINGKLADLAEQFTPEYMALDPSIIAMQRNADKLSQRLQEKIASSEQAYIDDAKRKLAQAHTSHQQYTEQLQDLSSQAHAFNQKLDQYKGMDDELRQLQGQAQLLQNQLVEQEVGQSLTSKISIIEPPFVPEFPFAPDYLKHSMFVLGAALSISLLSLLIFSFIVRQKPPQARVTNYTLLANAPNRQGLEAHPVDQDPRFALGGHSVVEPLQLQNNSAEASSVAQLRLLSEGECVLLYDTANQQGRLVIALLLSGLAPDELSQLNIDQFDPHFEHLHIAGRFARVLRLPASLSAEIASLSLAAGESLWTEPMGLSDFNHLVVNAAHDADIAFAEQLSVALLRHTYITNLLVQGCKLNDIEKVAGYIAASELGQYRGVKRQGHALPLAQLNTIFALDSALDSALDNDGPGV